MDNPYIGQAEGMAASAMDSAMSFTRALRSAADQQQRLQEQIQRRTYEEQLRQADLKTKGYQYYNPSQNVKPEASGSGLKTRDYQPPPEGLVYFPTTGVRMYPPDQTAKQKAEAEKAQEEGQKSLAERLEKGAEVVSPQGTYSRTINTPDLPIAGTNVAIPGQTQTTGIPVDDPHRTVSIGGRLINVPTSDEQAAAAGRKSGAEEQARQAGENWTFPDSLAAAAEAEMEKRQNLPPGTLKGSLRGPIPHEAVAGMFGKLLEKTPDKYTYDHYTDEKGKVNITRIGPDQTPQRWAGKDQGWVPLESDAHLGAAKKYADGAGSGSGGGKPVTAAERMKAALKISHDKNAALAKAEAEFRTSLRQPDDFAALVSAKQDAQDAYEESLKDLGVAVPHYSYRNDSGTPSAAAPKVNGPRPVATAAQGGGSGRSAGGATQVARITKPGPPQQDTHADNQVGGRSAAPAAQFTRSAQSSTARGQRVATLAQVRAYASKFGIKEADAIRRVKAEGFRIQGN